MIIPGRYYLVGGGIVLLLSLGGLWLHEHDNRVRAEARSAIYADSVRTLQAKVAIDSGKIIRADSIAHANALEVARIQAEADRRDQIAAANTKATVSALRATLNVQQRQQLDSIVTQYDARLAMKDSAYAASARLSNAGFAIQLASRDSTIKDLQQLNATLNNAWENERKISHPPLLKRLLDTGLKVGAGYAIRALTSNN